MPPLKLTEITDPRFEIELPDGSRKSYDLWELMERVARTDQDPPAGGDAPAPDRYDRIRRAFELPTAAEAVGAGEAPPSFTLSRSQCERLVTAVLEQVAEVDHVKKRQSLMRS